MKTLKREEMYTNRYNDLEQLRTNIEEFIEEYYNRQRLHSAFGYRSPEEFERQSEQVHRAESLGANVQFIVNDGNGENEERISTELSREGDSNAIPFPRPLLLLPDAAKAESKSACVPNFFSHNRGTSQRIGNKRGTKWEQNTEEHP